MMDKRSDRSKKHKTIYSRLTLRGNMLSCHVLSSEGIMNVDPNVDLRS